MIQVGAFTALGCVVYVLLNHFPEKGNDMVLLLECAMICLICPTATAAAVVTRKLGGDVAGITTYTILINMVVAVLVPLVVPMIHPFGDMSFALAFSLILAKIFPLLILPCLAAWLVRYLLPGLHAKFLKYPDLAFYIWTVALTLAIAMTVRYIVRSDIGPGLMALVGLVSLLCCAFQFFIGRRIGGTLSDGMSQGADERVTAGQSLGQKNTVFAIWMGYTFMDPASAIAGGFYTVWHNLFNAWQLRHRK
jgi:BASS family bile acid:Na+ symporter